jgi:uncharacterized protein with PIN domain
LQATLKETVDHQLEPKTRRYYDRFLQCEQCGQVYWQGSHHERARQLIGELLGKPAK